MTGVSTLLLVFVYRKSPTQFIIFSFSAAVIVSVLLIAMAGNWTAKCYSDIKDLESSTISVSPGLYVFLIYLFIYFVLLSSDTSFVSYLILIKNRSMIMPLVQGCLCLTFVLSTPFLYTYGVKRLEAMRTANNEHCWCHFLLKQYIDFFFFVVFFYFYFINIYIMLITFIDLYSGLLNIWIKGNKKKCTKKKEKKRKGNQTIKESRNQGINQTIKQAIKQSSNQVTKAIK